LSGRHMKLQTTRGTWRAAYSCKPFLLFAKSAAAAVLRCKSCLEVIPGVPLVRVFLGYLEFLAYLVSASESCLDVGGPLSSGHAVNFKMQLDDGRYDWERKRWSQPRTP
jgi:hypothetical protein